MSPQTKNRLEKFFLWLFSIIGTFGIVTIISLLLSVRDYQKYEQPLTDKDQTEQINFLKSKISECDSMSAVKNANTNKRIDDWNDLVKSMSMKINIMFNNDKKNEIIYQEVLRLQKLQTQE